MQPRCQIKNKQNGHITQDNTKTHGVALLITYLLLGEVPYDRVYFLQTRHVQKDTSIWHVQSWHRRYENNTDWTSQRNFLICFLHSVVTSVVTVTYSSSARIRPILYCTSTTSVMTSMNHVIFFLFVCFNMKFLESMKLWNVFFWDYSSLCHF